MPKFLFVCNDFIGKTMAGPGIRYWEIARALERKGDQAALLARSVEDASSRSGITFVGRASLAHLVSRIRWADRVILPGSPLAMLLCVLFRKHIIFDQYDPVVFEFLERTPASLGGVIRKSVMLALWKIRQRLILRYGHAFLVANDKQKDWLIGQLTSLGYLDKLKSVILLPFGLPAEKPARTRAVLRGREVKNTDFLLVWGGGIWDWFDPFTLLEAMARIKETRTDIKVYFPGVNPPNPGSRMLSVYDRFLSEAGRLGLLDTVVFVNRGWTPYEQRADYLLEADAGISLHRDSMETRFAFRTRMLDYLWAGLPIIASSGDNWGDSIERKKLGITTPPGDVDAVQNAIVRMADDAALRAACREHVLAEAEHYRWDELVKVLG